jgi:methanesulfonate monooxygenase small subunit
MTAAQTIEIDAARQLVARSCLALDDEDTQGFLSLCAPQFHYRIDVGSPELLSTMVWLEHDLAGLSELLGSLDDHLRRSGRLLRHLGASVQTAVDGTQLGLATSFTVLHTSLDGQTKLWAAGRYLDRIGLVDGKLQLLERVVDLHTRDLGIGSHVPV